VSILNPLFEAVAWIITKIHAGLSVPFGADSGWAWGLSIVILVMLMRAIMVPLFVKQVRSQRKMQAHMPQLAELRKRYKNDKQRLNEETMKFYKENGINPLGGCLPLLAQLPVFWSLFNVLKAISDWKPGTTPAYGLSKATVESALHAHIFGATLADKFLFPVPGEQWSSRLVILLFVIVSASTTFLTMRQSAKRGMLNQTPADPDQPGAAMAASMSKNMMYIAPLFALSGLYWQFGLVIYWVTTNIWTLCQQHILFRNLPVVGSTTVGASAVGAATGTAAAAVKGSGTSTSAAVRAKATAAKTGQSSSAAKAPAARTSAAKTSAAKTSAARTAAAKTAAAKAPVAKAPTSKAPVPKAQPNDNESVQDDVPSDAKVPAGNASAAKASAGKAPSSKARVLKAQPNDGESVQDDVPSDANAKANGAGRGLLRFGKGKQEPEPVPAAPQTKVVRQQPVRQSRSKRGNTGKR
jgi:YidC/Oxa1 family membrane protein insertase